MQLVACTIRLYKRSISPSSKKWRSTLFDYVGMGVLAVLLVLFGWLTSRAWRARNPALKWAGTILGGLLTLVVAIVIGAASYGFVLLNRTHTNPVANITVAGTPEQLARGQKLANSCVGCHSSNSQFPLAGQNFGEGGPPVGTLYAANLTPGGELKDWSDGEIVRAIREGIHKNGRSLMIMPAGSFKGLSDEDVQSLVAFLRTQPSTPATPPTNINLVGALIVALSGGEILTAQPPISGPVTAPPAGPTREYGQYLASSIGGCRDCHGANLTGGTPSGNGPPAGPNLTTVAQRWSEADFIKAMRTGQKPDGTMLSDDMPWKEINALASDDDLKALYAYLQSLPASQ
jgi:mono/diheme cytochrome c family protein